MPTLDVPSNHKTMTDETYKHPPTRWSSRIGVLIYLSILAGLGWAFASQGIEYLSVANNAPKYTPIQGKISSASIRTEAKNHLPDIKFEYQVDGKTYKGSNRYGAQSYRDNVLARQHIQRYQVNKPITVYVNPKNPEEAVISQDISKVPGLMRLTFGLIAFGAMIFSIVVFYRVVKRKRALAYSKHVLALERAKRKNS